MPASALQIVRFSAAGLWVYQGLVPKLLGPHADELFLVSQIGLPPSVQPAAIIVAGVGEILIGVSIAVFPFRTWPHVVALVVLTALFIPALFLAPHLLGAAFNPVASSVGLGALSAVGIALNQPHRRQ